MKWNLLFLVGLLMASTGCEADEPKMETSLWGKAVPDVITYDYVIQQYLRAGYMVDSLVSSSANTFDSPEAALEALHRDIAQGDSLWMAERVSKAGETIPISCTERGGRCFCSFQYKIIDVHFTVRLPDNLEHIFVGINDITSGDVDYTSPDTDWYTGNREPELTVRFQAVKKASVGGTPVYTQLASYAYNFIIDLGRMRATTF